MIRLPLLPVLLIVLLLLPAPPSTGQNFDGFSDWEMENYRRFQLEMIGRDPGLEEFRRGYEFILPLYRQFPQSEAYRICYGQAISGFPATPKNAPLHVRGHQALTDLNPADFAESGFMGILLLNLLERVSEDRALLTPASRSDSVHFAFLRADAVAASIFAYTLKMGTWNQVKAGSTDWTIRAGMTERRMKLNALSPAEKLGLPDWKNMERTAWLPETGRALSVLGPVLLDPRSYVPIPDSLSSISPGARRSVP